MGFVFWSRRRLRFGYGYHYCAARLNDDGVPSVDGGKWNSSQIKRILENPVCRGAIAWNKRTLGKLHGVAGDGTLRPKRGGKSSRNDRDDWFVAEDAHEPLVSPATFRNAEKAVAKRRHQGGLAKPVNRSLLSGLIICRHCGHRFLQKHINSTSGGKRLRYRSARPPQVGRRPLRPLRPLRCIGPHEGRRNARGPAARPRLRRSHRDRPA